MSQTEQATLASHYEEREREGLVDVKYCLSNAREASAEQVCKEVNRMHRALASNECSPLEFNDSNRE